MNFLRTSRRSKAIVRQTDRHDRNYKPRVVNKRHFVSRYFFALADDMAAFFITMHIAVMTIKYSNNDKYA